MIEQFPDDKSTVFSIAPSEVFEFKPGLYPGNFRIPACLDDREPSRLLVKASEHLMTIGGKKEPVRIITPSYQIAKSIVQDFLDGQMWAAPDAHPGVTWLQGDITVLDFKIKNKEIYEALKNKQKNWFLRICKQTDNEWKLHPSHRIVSDSARFAANYLGLDPDWLRSETIALEHDKCPACGTMNDNNNAICSNCKCILDEEKMKSLKFAS